MMKRIFWFGLLALVLGLGYAGLRRALTVPAAAAPVVRGQAKLTVTGSITVSAEAESTISSPDNGTLLESHLAVGQSVQAGEVLGHLDPGELPFRLEETRLNCNLIEAQLNEPLPSEISLQTAEKKVADETPLAQASPPLYPPAAFEDDQRTAQELKITAEHERSDLETRRKILKNSIDDYTAQIQRLNILAPYDGIITTLPAHAGDFLAKGAALATIVSTSYIIQAEVNQDDIAAVRENESAEVRFFAYPGQLLDARVKQILPSSDPATQRFTVLLDLPNPPKTIVSGLTGEVTFVAAKKDDALLIPRRALFGGQVFVVHDGVAHLTPVQTGLINLTTAEIVQGLAEGDLVLTEDPNSIRDGERVNVTVTPEKQP